MVGYTLTTTSYACVMAEEVECFWIVGPMLVELPHSSLRRKRIRVRRQKGRRGQKDIRRLTSILSDAETAC